MQLPNAVWSHPWLPLVQAFRAGPEVGAVVGSNVLGGSVGVGVPGATVGAAVGTTVGAEPDGPAVGLADGAGVGGVVGAAVGRMQDPIGTPAKQLRLVAAPCTKPGQSSGWSHAVWQLRRASSQSDPHRLPTRQGWLVLGITVYGAESDGVMR